MQPAPNDVRMRIRCSGERLVPSRPGEVFSLLTPEGERTWVPGWSPVYPGLKEPEDRPGTVFLTDHHGWEATWLIAEKDDDAWVATYAYVIPGIRATLVRVSCAPRGDDTIARIVYDMTSLSESQDADVRAFGDGFETMLDGWQKALTLAVQAP